MPTTTSSGNCANCCGGSSSSTSGSSGGDDTPLVCCPCDPNAAPDPLHATVTSAGGSCSFILYLTDPGDACAYNQRGFCDIAGVRHGFSFSFDGSSCDLGHDSGIDGVGPRCQEDWIVTKVNSCDPIDVEGEGYMTACDGDLTRGRIHIYE